MNTIAAISTPIGVGGVGIVRVSGDEALRIAGAIFDFANKSAEWQPLHMRFGTFKAKDFCDKGYAVYFPAKRAYTGEDTVEFYLHGGVRIMQGALDAILAQGARLAGRGEFTKRAFLSGRLSLADAEGVIDMINAESAAGLRAAYALMDGRLSREINAISDRLEALIAGLEASLDYPDEMEDEALAPLSDELNGCLAHIDRLLASASAGRFARQGLKVALIGAPNVGKSSLLNCMLGSDRAIVADKAGTTRDTVEAAMEYNGVKLILTDTAGLRESSDEVEAEGVERAKRAAESADVVLHVVDRSSPQDMAEIWGKPVFEVFNKCDVYGFAIPRMAHAHAVSAKTGEGVGELLDDVVSFAVADVGDGELIANERHISALYRAKDALKAAIASSDRTIDCILIDLREAYDALGEITGRSASESIVDSVFDRFCVGK